MINTEVLKQEAVEINRRLDNNYLLKEQHRKMIMELLKKSEDNNEVKELVEILNLTQPGKRGE